MKRSILLLIWSVGLTLCGSVQTFAQGTWQSEAPMPTARGNLGAGVVNGILYAVGGFNNSLLATTIVEAYDPVANVWSSKSPMSTRRNGVSAGVAVVGNTLYVMGGDTDGGASGYLASMEAYNPTTDTWSPRSPMITARSNPTVGVINGIIYAAGGQNPDLVAVSHLEAYDPTTDTWTAKAPILTPRYGGGAAVVNNILYVVGGQFASTIYGTVEAYDSTTDTWTTKAPMPTPRSSVAVAAVNNIIYAMGGLCGSPAAPCAVVEAYDPSTDTWTTVTPMPTTRWLHAAAAVNGIIFAVGGVDPSGYTARVDAFTPATAGALQVSPGDIAISGTEGGPFSPSSAQYLLTATSGTVNYVISGLPGWLNASATSGMATTSPTGVTFTITPFANTLAPSAYTATISFINTTNSQGNQTRMATLTVNAPTAEQQIAALEALIESFNLSQGIDNSLDAKLNAAEAALAAARANSTGTACNQLGAFINYTQAQSGQALTVDQGNQLLTDAMQIRATLRCS